MTLKAAILQSDYIPWKGYFDIINMVDVFVIYDDVQYTRRDWRNRNIIKTPSGLNWLTIPVEVKGKYFQKINEVKASDREWYFNHWQTIKTNYSKSSYFKQYCPDIESIYYSSPKENLSEINVHFLKSIMKILNIQTEIKLVVDLEISGEKTDRLVEICKKLGANIYLSGPAAQNYLRMDAFDRSNISVEWMDYRGYPEYTQLFPPFEHGVTILDLIFNTGPNATRFMKSFGR